MRKGLFEGLDMTMPEPTAEMVKAGKIVESIHALLLERCPGYSGVRAGLCDEEAAELDYDMALFICEGWE